MSVPHEVKMAIATAVFTGFGCVAQKLASLRMGIKLGADSQKAVAIDAHIDPAQLSRKLHGLEPVTLTDLDKLPEEVQRTFHLEELARLGLPERAHRWVKVAVAVTGDKRRSA
jgi:hypothetical protein